MTAPAHELCPACGHEDERVAFEGWEISPRDQAHGRRPEFVARCPECEALHPDQRQHVPVEEDLEALAARELELHEIATDLADILGEPGA